MSFAARLTRVPLPFDGDAAAELRAQFNDQPPELRDLLAGTAGCSPFLRGLMVQHADWLREALTIGPEGAVGAIMAGLAPGEPGDVGRALRRAKARVALIAGLADLGGVWPLLSVTGALTNLADRAVQVALSSHLAPDIARGRLPGAQPGDEEQGAGMVAFAMGKMGAFELNYSSDIDLICLFDETRFDPAEALDARQVFIRATRKMAATLSDHSADGYVFRTDLRLRPDASVTPVCISMDAAERYYESLGRTWERAAWIKARPCAGDLVAGGRFQDTLRPFIWRRHLDFAAIEDAHDMRMRIRAHKNLGGALVLEGHNMKLGQGGIREIEFFAQTRQLIAGGRDPDLRLRDTQGALRALSAKGWVDAAGAERMCALYEAHREIEHRLQMIGDAQTHSLPTSAEGFERLARFCGAGDTAAFRRDLLARLQETAELTEGFFAPSAPRKDERPEMTPAQRDLVRGWPALPAMRSDRARAIFERLEPELLSRLLASSNPDDALLGFDRFLSGLPTGVQLFSLFEANPTLVDLLIDILTTAPVLRGYLSHNAQVLDAVLAGDFFAPWPGGAALQAELTAALAQARDYEARLDTARRWMKERHFRIGVHHLRGLINQPEAARHYSDLAGAVLGAVWPVVCAEFARKHGPQPGRGAVVLGMGSLGAQVLNAGSDLDLIVVFDAGDAEASDGPRPLAPRPYFARLTQALVTALSAPMAQGRLYEVDMRLRPSGRQGPVATALAAFADYQRTEAWTWEHLALTRARAICGDAGLAAEIENFRRLLLTEKAAGDTVVTDVADMRARLRGAKPNTGVWDVKNGEGRGQDIDLVAQMLALRAASPARATGQQIQAAQRAGLIAKPDADALSGGARLFARVQGVLRLVVGEAPATDPLPAAIIARLLHETSETSAESLLARLEDTATTCAAIIARLTANG